MTNHNESQDTGATMDKITPWILLMQYDTLQCSELEIAALSHKLHTAKNYIQGLQKVCSHQFIIQYGGDINEVRRHRTYLGSVKFYCPKCGEHRFELCSDKNAEKSFETILLTSQLSASTDDAKRKKLLSIILAELEKLRKDITLSELLKIFENRGIQHQKATVKTYEYIW